MAPRAVSPKTLAAAEALFVEAFGRTMLNWSFVEQRLFWYFEHVSGMKHQMCRAVFYSARNFTAQADMLAAALSVPGAADDDLRAFLKAALKRARQYQELRNALAHGQAMMDANSGTPVAKRMVFIQGRDVLPIALDKPVTVRQLRIATNNFARLSGHLTNVYIYLATKGGQGVSPAKCLKPVLRLPSAADSRTPTPIPKERKPRRQP